MQEIKYRTHNNLQDEQDEHLEEIASIAQHIKSQSHQINS